MGTLGGLEQFLVMTRDNWESDLSVCTEQFYKGFMTLLEQKCVNTDFPFMAHSVLQVLLKGIFKQFKVHPIAVCLHWS